MELGSWKRRSLIGATLISLLAGCGGGGGDSAAQFAAAIGVDTPAPAPAPTPTPAATATTASADKSVNRRWVDFANGDDNNDGMTKATAWKHAPGDSNAVGVAGSYTPTKGTAIVFAANTRYFGSITAPFKGTSSAPIVFTGESDDQSAVIDGSSVSAQAQPCASQSACYGVAAWQSVSIVKFDEALPEGAQLYGNGNILAPAQWPNPSDLFYNEEVGGMAEDDGVSLNAGVAHVPSAVTASIKNIDDLRVAVWVRSNKIVERRVTSIGDGIINFDNTDVSAYTDRPSKFALRGHSAHIDMNGEYAIMPGRKAVLVKTADPRAVIYASAGRGGFDLANSDYVTVQNLAFEHMSDIDGKIRSGLPISAQSAPASNIRIVNNRFNDLVLYQGMGAMTLWDVTNLTIEGNTIARVAYGSGVRLIRNKNTKVFGNAISRVGRTGIMLMGNEDTAVVKNVIRDILGVHGNGFSAYLGNKRTKVIANTITEAYQPATFHGNGDNDPKGEEITFANNLFVATDDALGSLISWGKQQDKITIVNNILLGGGKGALRLAIGDTNLTAKRNVIAGIIYGDYYPSDWSVTDNVFTALAISQTKRYATDTISSNLVDGDLAGKAPSDLKKFCPYITELVDYTLLGQSYGRSIGAGYTCS